MTTTSDTFLAEGVARYGNALNTIDVFDRQVCQLIRKLLLAELPPLGLSPLQTKNAVVAKSGRSGSESWIFGRADGTLKSMKEPIAVEVGLWWNPSDVDEAVVFYSNFLQPKPLRSVSLRSSSGNAKFIDGAPNRLYTLPAAQPDIYKELHALLRQLLSVKLPKNP